MFRFLKFGANGGYVLFVIVISLVSIFIDHNYTYTIEWGMEVKRTTFQSFLLNIVSGLSSFHVGLALGLVTIAQSYRDPYYSYEKFGIPNKGLGVISLVFLFLSIYLLGKYWALIPLIVTCIICYKIYSYLKNISIR